MARTDCLSMILDEDIADRDTVAWRVEPAVVDSANPLIEPRYPWDSGATFAHGTFLLDPIDGLWKGWYLSTPPGEHARRLTYATSEDGINWTRPELDLCPQPGYPRSNVIFDFDSGGVSSFASVIVHPDAEAERRYEMFCMRVPGRPAGIGAKFVRGIEPKPGETGHPFATYRYFSPDGINWTAHEGPLLVPQMSARMILPYATPIGGADHSAYYLDEDGGYVLYQKVGETMHGGGFVPYDCFPQGRRVMARRTSPNGSDWSPLEVILQPDWRDPQDLQLMELIPMKVRGGYVGLLCCYNVLEQSIDWQFAASEDGRIWSRPSRRPSMPLAPLGDYGGGMLWPNHNFIEHGGRQYMIYSGLEGLHGDTYASEPNLNAFHGAVCRASWETDRYWAAVSAVGGATVGSFTTHPAPVGGKRLVLNAATSTVSEGDLEVELVDPDGAPIQGFTRADYQAWRGDSKSQPVRWTGGEVAPRDHVAARFFIRQSRLYGYAWE